MDANSQARGFQPGQVIADKYELEALVGEGGMGSVWRARHRQLESAVALKLMSPAIASQPEALNRFLREARAAARLSSLHVVKVFDFGVDGETPFIAMELLHGESLRQRLDRCGRLSPAATLWVIRQASRALTKAHAEGIVHRDLKPENLFITQQEEELLKVLDFGVAKLAGGASGPSTSTRTGALLGTPFYMSPEQARGIKAIDHRSDVWSLGVIAFECITGRLPFDSAAFGDLVLKICTLPAPVPSSVAQVPDGFDAWFARVTEREPEQRFQTVDELAEALRALLEPSSAAGPPASVLSVASTERPPRHTSTRTDVTASQSLMAVLPRRGWGRSWLLAAFAALLGVGGVSLWLARGEPARPARGSNAAARGKSGGSTAARNVAAPAAAELEEPAAVPAVAVPAVAVPVAEARPEQADSEAEEVPASGGASGAPGVHLVVPTERSVPGSTASSAVHAVGRASAAAPRARRGNAPQRAVRAPANTPEPATKLAPKSDLFSDPD